MNDKQRDQCAGINTKGANFCPVSPWRKDVIERFIFFGLHNPGEHNPGGTSAAQSSATITVDAGEMLPVRSDLASLLGIDIDHGHTTDKTPSEGTVRSEGAARLGPCALIHIDKVDIDIVDGGHGRLVLPVTEDT